MPAAVRGPFRRPLPTFPRKQKPATKGRRHPNIGHWLGDLLDPAELGWRELACSVASCVTIPPDPLNCPRLLCNDSGQVIRHGNMVAQSLGLTIKYCNKQNGAEE